MLKEQFGKLEAYEGQLWAEWYLVADSNGFLVVLMGFVVPTKQGCLPAEVMWNSGSIEKTRCQETTAGELVKQQFSSFKMACSVGAE